MANAYLNVGMLIPVHGRDLDTNDVAATTQPGKLSFVIDAFGPRIFQYVRMWQGSAMAQGELMSQVSDLPVTDITSGSTTSATKAASFTADKHVGMLLYVDDNDDEAGGEPEGEVGVIISSTAAVVTIDAARPFSVALAANDDVRVVSLWTGEDSADGDQARTVLGVVVGVDGITDQYYGWVQSYGVCPDVLHVTTSVAVGGAVVADAAAVNDAGADAANLWVGYQIGAYTAASHDTLKTPVFINVFGAIGGA